MCDGAVWGDPIMRDRDSEDGQAQLSKELLEVLLARVWPIASPFGFVASNRA